MSDSKTFLPHINGLRALAILGVLLYHLNSQYCPAGYFGVDIFLVISGFFLFRSLMDRAQSFHYGHFLLGKAWRIVPSWFVVTLAAAVVAYFLLPPERYIEFLKTARASALLHADYHIDKSTDYFNVFSQQNLLLHFWYLSITQQLYLVAPLLVVPLARYCSRRTAAIFLGVLCLLSLVYYVLATMNPPFDQSFKENLLAAVGTKTAYYHLLPRFWEVAAGAGVFLLPEFAESPRLRSLLGLLGLGGLLTSFYLYETGSAANYLAVFCTLLTLRYASDGIAARLLNCRSLQMLGTISFSLYLWHWPVMVLWKYCRFDNPGAWDEVGMVALSLLLGSLSWWAVERIRMPRMAGWKGTMLRCSLLLLIPLVVVSAVKVNKYVRKRMHAVAIPERRLTLALNNEYETQASVLRGSEKLENLGQAKPIYRLGAGDGEPSFVILGDSHRVHLYDDLNAACKAHGIRGISIAVSFAPFEGVLLTMRQGDWLRSDKDTLDAFLHYLEAHPEVRCVVLSLYWAYRINDITFRDEQTGALFADSEQRLAAVEKGLRAFADRLRAMRRTLLILGDNPSFDPPSPIDEWERCEKLNITWRGRYLTQKQHETRNAEAYRIHEKLIREGRVRYIDIAPALMVDGRYPARLNDKFLYQDTNHLSSEGARLVIEYLMPRLQALLKEIAPDDAASAQAPDKVLP